MKQYYESEKRKKKVMMEKEYIKEEGGGWGQEPAKPVIFLLCCPPTNTHFTLFSFFFSPFTQPFYNLFPHLIIFDHLIHILTAILHKPLTFLLIFSHSHFIL